MTAVCFILEAHSRAVGYRRSAQCEKRSCVIPTPTPTPTPTSTSTPTLATAIVAAPTMIDAHTLGILYTAWMRAIHRWNASVSLYYINVV